MSNEKDFTDALLGKAHPDRGDITGIKGWDPSSLDRMIEKEVGQGSTHEVGQGSTHEVVPKFEIDESPEAFIYLPYESTITREQFEEGDIIGPYSMTKVQELAIEYPYPKSPQLGEDEFLADIARHEMHIKRNDGLYRHVHFCRPDSGIGRFSLHTSPGGLTITGDMGTYVFQRIEDMFVFFRRYAKSDKKLPINPHYWGEKCVATDRCGIEKFDAEYAKARIVEHMAEYEFTDELALKVVEETFYIADDGDIRFHDALTDIHTVEQEAKRENGWREKRHYLFSGVWEFDFKTYTYQYLWCLYAIVWGIQQYDAAFPEEPKEDNGAT